MDKILKEAVKELRNIANELKQFNREFKKYRENDKKYADWCMDEDDTEIQDEDLDHYIL